jgi:hypothetical protein
MQLQIQIRPVLRSFTHVHPVFRVKESLKRRLRAAHGHELTRTGSQNPLVVYIYIKLKCIMIQQNYAHPTGSGSTTLVLWMSNINERPVGMLDMKRRYKTWVVSKIRL